MTTENTNGALVPVSHAPASTRLPGSTATRIQNLPDGSLAGLDHWRKRLAAARSPLTALDAYSGDAWSQVKAGHAACPAPPPRSGSPPPASAWFPPVMPYQITPHRFRPKTRTARARTPTACSAGGKLSARPTITSTACRRECRAGAGQPGSHLSHGTNADSLAALHADLWEAREAAADPERFLILAGGRPPASDSANRCCAWTPGSSACSAARATRSPPGCSATCCPNSPWMNSAPPCSSHGSSRCRGGCPSRNPAPNRSPAGKSPRSSWTTSYVPNFRQSASQTRDAFAEIEGGREDLRWKIIPAIL